MYGERALSRGTQGYVTKGDPHALLDAIACMLAGDNYRHRGRAPRR